MSLARTAVLMTMLTSATCVSLAGAQLLSVSYEANMLPNEDPIAPWTPFGHDCIVTAAGGELTIENPNTSAWGFFHRYEETLPSYPEVYVEARVKVPQSNNWPGSPQLSMYDYRQEGHSPGDIAHLWYAIDLYPDRIELTRADNDVSPPEYTVLASVPVPDLGTDFHVVGLTRLEAADRSFFVFLDGVQVASVTAEPIDRPMDGVGFGYGRGLGMGLSVWDHVRYWSIDPIATEAATWGRVKATFR